MLILGEEEVRALLSYEQLIPVIRQALIDFSAGRVQQPVRAIIPVPAHGGWFGIMPAVYGSVMGAKMVTFYPRNAEQQKHTHMAMIQLFRADTGEPLAMMDGRLITEMRTAAVSAVAIDHLAHPAANVLGILGSGVQARSHIRALKGIRAFTEIRVWSRTREHAERFAAEIGATVTTAEEAVSGADVVLALTSSAVPIVQGRWLKKDAMVCAIGAATPDRRELDAEAMRGVVVVESREAAMREAGDIVLANAQITAEIGELLSGAHIGAHIGAHTGAHIGSHIGRGNRRIVFKSVGLAVEDMATAKLVLDQKGSSHV